MEKCPICGAQMKALFSSVYCPRCASGAVAGTMWTNEDTRKLHELTVTNEAVFVVRNTNPTFTPRQCRRLMELSLGLNVDINLGKVDWDQISRKWNEEDDVGSSHFYSGEGINLEVEACYSDGDRMLIVSTYIEPEDEPKNDREAIELAARLAVAEDGPPHYPAAVVRVDGRAVYRTRTDEYPWQRE